MDPNSTLKEIRILVRALYEHCDGIRTLPVDEMEGKAFQLAILVNSMDEWLTDGGQSPADWGAQRIGRSK